MGRVKRYLPGTPSWVDLGTPDSDGAKRFYAGLFGWEAVDLSAGRGMVYTMLNKGGAAAAALFPVTPEMVDAGAPRGWHTYITVSDADAATARAAELGATVIQGPFDVAESGRISTLRDPVGALVSLWQPIGHIGCEVVNEPGALTWCELVTGDVDGARAFYEGLLGWEGSVGESGYLGMTNSVGDETVYAGGILQTPEWAAPEAVPFWIPYFGVDDIEVSRGQVVELGGSLVTDVIEPDPTRLCVVRDPQGALFYLFENPSGETGPSSDKLK